MNSDYNGSPDVVTDDNLIDHKTIAEEFRRNGYEVVAEEAGLVVVKPKDSPAARSMRPIPRSAVMAGALALMGATGIDLATAFDRCVRRRRGGFVNCPDCGNPYNPTKGDRCFKCQNR